MELSWTTLTLEVVNFLILVWLLKRFLYRPVLDVIARRKADIDKTLHDAEQARAEADELRARYENRLGEWERERQSARAELRQELENERREQLGKLQSTLDAERERAAVLGQRHAQEAQRDAERIALEQGAQFSARLLAKLSGPELQPRLVNWFAEDLDSLSPARRTRIARVWRQSQAPVRVLSAAPLSPESRQFIDQALRKLLDQPPESLYDIDPQLIAGVRVQLGPTVLRANLQDELAYFVESANESGES